MQSLRISLAFLGVILTFSVPLFLGKEGVMHAYAAGRDGDPLRGLSLFARVLTQLEEVYVEELASGGRWQVSERESLRPRWSSDGRRLYFLGRQGLQAVDVTSDGEPRFSRPRRLLEGPRFLRHETAPGGRVVVVEEDDVRRSRELRVIVDWFSEWR